MVRKTWAAKTKKPDKKLLTLWDLETAALEIDDDELQIARTNVYGVMQASGISLAEMDPSGMSSGADMGGPSVLDTALSKQLGALETVIGRANDAACSMTKVEQGMNQRHNAVTREQPRGTYGREAGFYAESAPSASEYGNRGNGGGNRNGRR